MAFNGHVPGVTLTPYRPGLFFDSNPTPDMVVGRVCAGVAGVACIAGAIAAKVFAASNFLCGILGALGASFTFYAIAGGLIPMVLCALTIGIVLTIAKIALLAAFLDRARLPKT